MSPEATNTIIDSSNRVKQTYACEVCRRRKARCSGTAPCSLCQKTGQDCEFVYQRHRRGRKTKVQHSAPRLVLPAQSSPGREGPSSDAQPSAGPRTVLSPESSIPVPSSTIQQTTVEAPPQDQPASPIEFLDGPLHNEVSYPAESDPPPQQEDTQIARNTIRKWPTQLGSLLENDLLAMVQLPCNQNASSILPFLLHLLDLFFSTVARQYPYFITQDHFLRTVQNGSCRPYLCYALCVISLPWSRREQFQDDNFGILLQRMLALNVRKALACASQLRNPVGLLTFCAAIIYETSQGNGVQAWLDIGSASSLRRLLILGRKRCETEKCISAVEEFLQIMELSLTLGQAKIQLPISNLCESGGDIDQSNLHSLCYISVKIQQGSTLGFSEGTHPPWFSGSEFMSLRQTLESIRLALPDAFPCDEKDLRSEFMTDDTIAQNILASVSWHLSVVLLNIVFLPIPVLPSYGGVETLSKHELIYYPNAPRLFLRERMIACEASAAGIARICKNIMVKGIPLVAPQLGYACFHAALVFDNQLKRDPLTSLPDVEMQLKIVSTMLCATRCFHKSAISWIEVLREIQRSMPRFYISDGTEGLFKGYFDRFEGISEPPFASLEDVSTVKASSPELRNTQLRSDVPSRSEPSTDDVNNNDWMQEYQSLLAGDLDSTALEKQPEHYIEPLMEMERDDTSTRSQETLNTISEFNQLGRVVNNNKDALAVPYVRDQISGHENDDMGLYYGLDQNLPDGWVNGLLELFSSEASDLNPDFSGFEFRF